LSRRRRRRRERGQEGHREREREREFIRNNTPYPFATPNKPETCRLRIFFLDATNSICNAKKASL
jgi:hypothetical protein